MHGNNREQMTADLVKHKAIELGSDICGIAGISRFIDMPEISNPKAFFPEAKSVIVIAKKFLNSTIESKSTIPYTIIRNRISNRIDDITIELAYFFEEHGVFAIPTGAIEPCNYDSRLSKTMGLISLKNAAYQAGLGVIGKNTLLITPHYGNMIWLGAIIASIELEQDRIIEKNPCIGECKLCIENCPVNALDGSKFMNQKKCWEFAFGSENGGEWRIKCNKCRIICPFNLGFKSK